MRKLVALAVACLAACTLCLAASTLGAAAETYPSRVITMVVPYPAGGPTDTIARILAERMQAALGQSVIIENVSGAGGSIGVGRVAHAAPDGYTIMMATAATTAGNPNLMKSLPYDPLKDFIPAGFIGSLQFVLLTRNEPGSATLADFIKRAKSARPPLTSGAGTPSARVCTATLGERIGAELVYVPYKAAPLALADLLSGQIDMTFGDVSIAAPQVKAGKVKALVLASDSPSVLLPGVPTFEQAGLGQFSLDAWFVLLMPAKTPPEIVDKIDKAVQEIVVDPKVIERLHSMSFEPRQMASADVRSFIKAEIDKWRRLTRAAGIEKE
jgi:tripartite-type tricarboxylate transporter receptor subunit TctC